MKRTIEFLASVEIEVSNPDDMPEAIHAARCRISRIHETGPDWSMSVPTVVQMSTEQSRAVRMVTATAKNGGSVPGTMEEVVDGVKAILGDPERQGGSTRFVADSAGGEA